MKKIVTISILFILTAFWTCPGQAGNVVYFAPDGSQITKADYDRLVSGKANSKLKSKQTAQPKVIKKPVKMASLSESKPAAVKTRPVQPKKSKALKAGKISEIRESDIREITKDVLHSTNKRNPQGLIAYLAPSYKASLKTYEGELSLARDEYVAYLAEGWSGYGFYRMRQEGEKITVSPDKQKATLKTDIIEIASLTDGTTIKLRSHQKWLFEIVEGKILITSSEAEVEGL
jgi:hypothetical protein